MARFEIVTYTCNTCTDLTGKEVTGERITVGGVLFDVCAKHRKIPDQYVEFASKYGQSPERVARELRPRSANGTPATRRYECGLCKDQGETKVVAHNSRSWHAKQHHGGLKASDITWHEV